jgi:hypothetical protein
MKYFIHILGPDDVIEQPDELTALREANALNKSIASKRNPDGNDPWGMAVVIDESDPNARAAGF